MKTCTKCKQTKTLSEFTRCKESKDGLAWWCKSCHKAYKRDWKRTPKGKLYSKVKFRRQTLKKRYGLTLQKYEDMLHNQDGCCAICGKKETRLLFDKVCALSVDHDHSNGKVRKLLCNKCNRILGWAHDDVVLLYAMIKYLNFFR